jgi:mono/diheme cytochrome c family protein
MGSMERKIILGWGLTLVTAIFVLVYWLNEPNRMALAREEFRLEAVHRGAELYADHCARCHGDEGRGIDNLGPPLNSKNFLDLYDDQAILAVPREGRPNTMMSAFAEEQGGPLRDSQLKDLVAFIRNWEETAPLLPEATPVIDAASLYAQYCAGCHGPNGEGTDAVSLALNSKGFLDRTDDALLYQLTAQGRPEQGMPAFAGVLSNEEINALVAFIRAWEATAPDVQLAEETLYARYCAFCHGPNGEGATNVPVVLNSQQFLAAHDDDYLGRVVAQGHENMPPWSEEQGGVLTTEQIDDVVAFIRAWEKPGEKPSELKTPEVETPEAKTPEVETPEAKTPEAVSVPGFAADILPLFQEQCAVCHSATQALGGWDGSSYAGVMESGDHAPVVIPGDPESSLLVQKMLGTQTVGAQMPVTQLLPPELVQMVIEWVRAGAPDN